MTLSHLEKLHDTLETPDGDDVHVWWIYARPVGDYDGRPPTDAEYERFHASKEGIACVDDVARAAVVYLDHYDVHGDDLSLTRARQALEFVRYMQADDGRFLNFVTDPSLNERVFGDPDPDVVDGIKVDGSKTSEATLEYWSSRACWVLGRGYETFIDEDPSFAEDLSAAIHSYLDAVDDGPLSRYGEYSTTRGHRTPDWLIEEDAYTTAPVLLGLASYVRASDDPRATDRLRKLADGLLECETGDAVEHPFGAHLSRPPGKSWHTWGLRQAAGLAKAGNVLDDAEYVASARREVATLHTHHLASHGQIGSFGPSPLPYHQLSYGTDALVQGCTEVWRATDEIGYAQLGAQLAAWYNGNNVEAARMWDPEAGRGYDGIYQDTIDWKAGAESTIAAARTMLDMERYPDSATFDGECVVPDARSFVVVNAVDGVMTEKATRLVTDTGGALLAGGQIARIFRDGEVTIDPDVPSGEYRLYLVCERTIAPDSTAILTVDEQRRTIDIGSAADAHYQMIALDPIRIGAEATLSLSYDGASDRHAKADSIVFQPTVGHRIVSSRDDDLAVGVLRSFVDEERTGSVPIPFDGSFDLELCRFDESGTLAAHRTEQRGDATDVDVPVEPRGFSTVRMTPVDAPDEP